MSIKSSDLVLIVYNSLDIFLYTSICLQEKKHGKLELLGVMGVKDGSWSSMISAHPNGQIFADLVICPYYFMCEESIFSHY